MEISASNIYKVLKARGVENLHHANSAIAYLVGCVPQCNCGYSICNFLGTHHPIPVLKTRSPLETLVQNAIAQEKSSSSVDPNLRSLPLKVQPSQRREARMIFHEFLPPVRQWGAIE